MSSNPITPGQAMHHLLVVDPEPSIRNALKAGLSSYSCRVDTAEDGAQGLRLCSQGHYDLIVVSLVLPDLDGYEVIRIIQSRRPETIAIAITERTVQEEPANDFTHGVSMYLEKPLKLKSVTDAIARGFAERALKHKDPQT